MATLYIEAKGNLAAQALSFPKGDVESANHTAANFTLTTTSSWQSTTPTLGDTCGYLIITNAGSEIAEVKFSAEEPDSAAVILPNTQRVVYKNPEFSGDLLWYKHY